MSICVSIKIHVYIYIYIYLYLYIYICLITTSNAFRTPMLCQDSEADTLGATKTPTAQWLQKAQGYSCAKLRVDFMVIKR